MVLFEIEGCVFIDGVLCDVYGGRMFDCVSLIDGCVLVKVVDCGEVDVNVVVVVVCCVFDVGVWVGLNLCVCKVVLLCWVVLMCEYFDELLLFEMFDVGKLIGDMMMVDVLGVVYCVEWFVEVIDKVGGEVVLVDYYFVGFVMCELVGVVVVVVLWNFLILMVVWKFGFVFVVGNSVVLKLLEKLLLIVICVV